MPGPQLQGARRVDVKKVHETRPNIPALSGARPVQAPTMSRFDALGAGAHQGARASLPIAGMIVGGTLGSVEPGGGTLLGAALGAGIGESLGRVIDRHTDVPTVDELPPELRPWGVAGEILGGSVAPGAAPLAGSGRSGVRWIDRIVQSAKARPVAYGISEAAAAGGAATGAGVASELYGGNPGAELAGGLIGGVASPGSATLALTSLASDAVQRTRQWLSVAGRESRAAAELRTLLDESGEDPALLAKRLRELSMPSSDTRTAAQLTGSPALQLLEAELSRRNATFGREAGKRGAESLEILRGLIGRLSATGDPSAMREAAQLRQRYFEGLIGGRLEVAEREAAEVATKITTDSPASRAELSRRAEEILSNALSQARAVERELWAKIPGHAVSPRKALLAEANRIAKEDLLPGEKLPSVAGMFLQRIRQRGPNVRQMLLFRSRMLDEGRKAAAASDMNQARIFGKLAEAALDDLEGTIGADEARAFSRTLNDVFTRSFVGKALADDKLGGARIPPEVLMRRATAGPAEAVGLRLQELERAVRLGSPEAASEMLQIQERFLRLAAADIVDPNTGVASAPRLNRFMRFNEELLNRFPEVRDVMMNVQSANAYLKAARESAKQATTQIGREAAFAKVANSENPIRTVSQIVNGPAPQQQFRQLATMARTHGDAAVLGMRSAVLQDAFERAGGTQGQFSFTAFRSTLLDPPRPGQSSAMELMRSNGVIDADTASRLTRLLNEADKVEAALRTRPQLETLLASENLMLDFVLRAAGSKLGTAASSLLGSNTAPALIAASAGSRVARTVFDKVPTGRVQDVLIQAAENPSFMATLLERAPTQADKLRVARKANAWLIGLGLAATSDQGEQP